MPSNDKSIAVLPFANLSPDKENEFLADGVHADLLSVLTGLRELKPIGGALRATVRAGPGHRRGIKGGALARYTNFVLRDWKGARQQVERLRRIAPNAAVAIATLAQYQIHEGFYADALENFQQAERLDPLSGVYAGNLAYLLWRGRRFEAAAESMRRELALRPATGVESALARLAFQATGSVREAEELAALLAARDPRAPEGLRWRTLAAIWRGDLAEAVRSDQGRPPESDAKPGNAPGFVNGDGTGDMALIHLQRGDAAAARRRLGSFPELLRADLLREPENSRVLRYLGTLEAILGRKEEALRHAEKSVALATSPSVRINAREVLAQVCAIVGEKDRALAELAELLRQPSQVNVNELKVMPVYFKLRGDPRFEALVNDPKNQAPLF